MEFSWNYGETMRHMATDISAGQQATYQDAKDCQAFSIMLKFDVKGRGCEVPSFALDKVDGYIPENLDEIATFVLPLNVGQYTRNASGAETILKHFTRSNDGRLNRVITPKGEVYYGNGGIILDKDFKPLMLSTVALIFDEAANRFSRQHYVIHLSPLVFTNDEGLLNKSLAKKGIAYYLTHNTSTWGNNGLPYKVVIDDCSDYFVKAHRPDVNNCSDRELNQVLKENIDEVLRQIANDAGRNFF